MQRSERVGDEIRTILSSMIQNDLKDPRIPDMVSVVGVRATRDLSHAYAHISILGDEKQKSDCAKALESAKGYIRREIGKKIRLRMTPEIHFVFDNSIERGFAIGQILDEVMGRNGEVTPEPDSHGNEGG